MEPVQSQPSERIERVFLLPDEGATADLAAALAGRARVGDVIALWGDLGSGKTAFARAFINALPGAREEVPSPTFTLVQGYRRGGLALSHFDLYRVHDPEELTELGWDEALAESVVLVEWPERAGPWLPAARLDLRLEIASRDGLRRAALSGSGDWPERLADLQPVRADRAAP